jgi:hypothetical protein
MPVFRYRLGNRHCDKTRFDRLLSFLVYARDGSNAEGAGCVVARRWLVVSSLDFSVEIMQP